jgi:hypothetical protein
MRARYDVVIEKPSAQSSSAAGRPATTGGSADGERSAARSAN